MKTNTAFGNLQLLLQAALLTMQKNINEFKKKQQQQTKNPNKKYMLVRLKSSIKKQGDWQRLQHSVERYSVTTL